MRKLFVVLVVMLPFSSFYFESCQTRATNLRGEVRVEDAQTHLLDSTENVNNSLAEKYPLLPADEKF